MPDALLAHAAERIGWYSTILTRVRLEGPTGEEAEQAGTGTFVWNEWAIFNAAAAGTMLNRKVEAVGTKPAGELWTLEVGIVIS